MGEAEEFGRHSLGVAVSRLILAAAVLATSLITARWLGPHGRGEYAVAVLLATILVIVTDVMSPGALFFSARRDYPRQRILGSTLVVSSALGVVTIVACLALAPLSGMLFGDVPRVYLLLALLGVPFGLVISDAANMLLGARDYLGYNGALIAQYTVLLAFVSVTLIALGGGPGAAIGATSFSTALVAAGVLGWGRRRAGGIDLKPDRGYIRDAARYGARAQIGSVLSYLANRIDILLVNGYLNPAAVGFYSISLATAERTLTVADAGAAALFPRIAADRDGEGRASSLTPIVVRTVLWMTALAAAATFAISHWLVLLLYSGRFEPAVRPLQILLLSMVAAAPARILGTDVSARGRPELASAVACLALVANVSLNAVLIPRYGISGAAWASVGSYSFGAVLILGVYLRLSGNLLRSVLVPRRQDIVLLRRIVVGLFKRAPLRPADRES